MAHVYLLKSHFMDADYFKIGFTKGSVKARVGALNTANPFGITLVDSFSSEKARGDEAYLHKLFADKRCNGEWFLLTPEDIERFSNYAEWVTSGRMKLIVTKSETFIYA